MTHIKTANEKDWLPTGSVGHAFASVSLSETPDFWRRQSRLEHENIWCISIYLIKACESTAQAAWTSYAKSNAGSMIVLINHLTIEEQVELVATRSWNKVVGTCSLVEVKLHHLSYCRVWFSSPRIFCCLQITQCHFNPLSCKGPVVLKNDFTKQVCFILAISSFENMQSCSSYTWFPIDFLQIERSAMDQLSRQQYHPDILM